MIKMAGKLVNKQKGKSNRMRWGRKKRQCKRTEKDGNAAKFEICDEITKRRREGKRMEGGRGLGYGGARYERKV